MNIFFGADMRILIISLLFAGCAANPPVQYVKLKTCPEMHDGQFQRDLTQPWQNAAYLLPDGSVCQRDYSVVKSTSES